MSSFDLQKFVAEPSLGQLRNIRKIDWINLAQHYDVVIRANWRKFEIVNAVVRYLIVSNILSADANVLVTEPVEDEHVRQARLDKEFKFKELELVKQTEIEHAKLRLENERMKLEIQLKEKVELERLRLGVPSVPEPSFKFNEALKSVPVFDENELESFFLQFEKIATQREWPKDKWSIIIQGAYRGKARDVFAALSLDDSSNYDIVKREILKAYEWVPEKYRIKFRELKKRDSQTYMEFAREQKLWYDRWVNSKDVNSDYGRLEELVLLEQFKVSIHSDVRTYLDENNINQVSEACKLADNYSTIHKLSKRAGTPFQSKSFSRFSKNGISNAQNNDHYFAKYVDFKKDQSEKTVPAQNMSKNNLICHYCKEVGHYKNNCPKLSNRPALNVNVGAKDGAKQPCSDSHKGVGFVQKEEKFNSELLRDNDKTASLSNPSVVKTDSLFENFICNGTVTDCKSNLSRNIKILRDTGAAQSLLVENVLPNLTYSDESVLLRGIGGAIKVPLSKLHLSSKFFTGEAMLGMVKELPVNDISMILGNDLCSEVKVVNPVVSENPVSMNDTERLAELFPGIFPSCAVTRSMTEHVHESGNSSSLGTDALSDLNDLFDENVECDGMQIVANQTENNSVDVKTHIDILPVGSDFKIDRESLIDAQKKDESLKELWINAVGEDDINDYSVCMYTKNGVLMRKWKPLSAPAYESWKESRQLVVPKQYRNHVLSLAHDTPMSGHLGIRKTFDKLTKHFFWPNCRKDVSYYVNTCHNCQKVNKPTHVPKVAPLKPIPVADEPFSKLVIDIVGPLPKSKNGFKYLFTIMCSATRFPEAIPLRSIDSKNIIEALKKFFSFVGLPRVIQSDQGSNFMSHNFAKFLKDLGIKHVTSTVYHPQSQGMLERFHQTFKNMLRMFCHENDKDWDQYVSFLLFAIRDAVQDSLGMSPFELVFGHTVRGPLRLLKDEWLKDDETNLFDHISTLKAKVTSAWKVARDNLASSQMQMKNLYDKNSEMRSFNVNEEVLVLLPTPGQPFSAKYFGPYKIIKKINDLNYLVNIPEGRRKEKMLHINLLKKYHRRDAALLVNITDSNLNEMQQQNGCANVSNSTFNGDESHMEKKCGETKLCNSSVLLNLDSKVGHLESNQEESIVTLLHKYIDLFPDAPKKCKHIQFNIDVMDESPIKQHPYRLSPHKRKILSDEIDYLLEHDIVEPSTSAWASPCILVEKPDGSFRMCTDYRKLNLITKSDSYPLPRIDDILDNVGRAKYMSKLDLLKGYYQIPLSAKSKKFSAFATHNGLYQYKVLPFGLKNAPVVFQRYISHALRDLKGTEVYIDDIIVVGDTWEEHLNRLEMVFSRLRKYNLTVNLLKSEFGFAKLKFLGYEIGNGEIAPINAKVEAMCTFPVPSCKKGVMRFLGMTGYYRKFCRNFSDMASPLTNLLQKNVKFHWDLKCQKSFDNLKCLLSNAPVLRAPNFDKQFILQIDASDTGAGSVLMQCYDILHPVSYFSRKFTKYQRNYSVIEKETLSLILSLEFFNVYLESSKYPILVYTDHNPLTFINRMKNKNQRLMRWSILIQSYNLEVKHIDGKNNVIADALSR